MGTLMISIIFSMCINEIAKSLGWRPQQHQSTHPIKT